MTPADLTPADLTPADPTPADREQPAGSEDDTDLGWGELPDLDESWLLERRPPHWE